ncbi:hypothetical protein G7054_g4145 [Neopestalotiopsis clavispora]|nr:hypothetical protein G7054_g4145 [Neopestalotiopsis clavispora]
MTSTDPPFQSIKYLPTTEAYNRWAAVYDTDGNFLQALDDLEMRTLFPKFEAALQPTAGSRKLVDLGCGTGRNTVQLLGIENASIVALDASPGMLAVAERRLNDLVKAAEDQEATSLGYENLTLEVFDLLTCDSPPDIARQADGVISTLVLEHIPLDIFFRHASQMLKVNGVLLLTNMHGDMGQISQAGFVDNETGEKVRPTSYAHTVESVIEEARKHGIVAIDGDNTDNSGLMERAVTDEMVKLLGPRSRKWVGIRCCLLGAMASSGDSSSGGGIGNATEYLLGELLKVIKDKIATDDSTTDWDPITFAFTVPVGVFGILATLLAFVTIVQGIFAASPGRRKSSRRVIGKWADIRWTNFHWDELRTTTFVKTPILRANALSRAIQTRNHKSRDGTSESKTVPTVFTKTHVVDVAPTQANWLKLFAHFHLDDIEFGEEDLEITATDHIPDELRAVYAYTDIGTMVALGVVAGAKNLEPEPGSSYPILIGTEIQIEFRQHPVLGTVAAFSKYGSKTSPSRSVDLDQRLLPALRHSNAEVECNVPEYWDLNDAQFIEDSGWNDAPFIHVTWNVDDFLRHSDTTFIKEVLHGHKDYEQNCDPASLCVCRMQWRRFGSNSLFWLFAAKTPTDVPTIFPSSHVAVRKTLTTLCLQSRFWSAARATHTLQDLYSTSLTDWSSVSWGMEFCEFLDKWNWKTIQGDTTLPNCLRFLLGSNEVVVDMWSIRWLLTTVDRIIATLPDSVVGCRRADLFIATSIVERFSRHLKAETLEKSTPNPGATPRMHSITSTKGTIMQEHLEDLKELDVFISRGAHQCANEMPITFDSVTGYPYENEQTQTAFDRIERMVEQCATVAACLDDQGKEHPQEDNNQQIDNNVRRSPIEVLDDIIIWRAILIGTLFSSAPDNSKMFESAVWNHVIPLL